MSGGRCALVEELLQLLVGEVDQELLEVRVGVRVRARARCRIRVRVRVMVRARARG